jgi:thiol-disulfide isomerase/thioredoxin
MNVTDWKTKSEFQNTIGAPGRHLIVLAAKWCGFCSRFIEQAKALQTKAPVELSLVDADNPDESLWDDFQIKIVPTLLVFENRKILFRRDGRSGAGLRMSDLEEGIAETVS